MCFQLQIDKGLFQANRTRNGRRSHNFKASQKKLLLKQFEIENENMQTMIENKNSSKWVNKDDDSDIYGVSDSNREAEDKTNRYVGKAAFNHYYNNYK